MQIYSTKSDILWNYVGILMTMGSNLLLLPFLLRYIYSEFLGLWYVYLSIGGIVTLFDFGFIPTFARNISYCWSGVKELTPTGVIMSDNTEPNYELLKRVIKTCKLIYLAISLIAICILSTFGSAYIYHISKNIFNNTVIISWIIYITAVFLNLYYGYYATFLRGVGAVAQSNKINVISRILQLIVSISMLLMGYGIIAVSLGYLLYGFTLRFLSKKAFYTYQNLDKHLQKVKSDSNFSEVKKLFFIVWHNAWRDGLVTVANYFANHSSTLIASLFFTLTETGIYSISVQLLTAIATISGGLYSAYQPSMQSAFVNKNKKEAGRLMSIVMVTYTTLFWVGFLGLIIVGMPVLKILKPDVLFDVNVLAGLAVYKFLFRRHSLYASFISNTNQVPYYKSYLLFGIVGVFLSVAIIIKLQLGVWGLIIGQFLAQLMYNFWKWPLVVYSILEINWLEFVKMGIESIHLTIRRYKK